MLKLEFLLKEENMNSLQFVSDDSGQYDDDSMIYILKLHL